MTSRLGKHFLRRLRCETEMTAFAQAAAYGVLAEETRDVDGHSVRLFMPGKAMAEKSDAEIARLLKLHGTRASRNELDSGDVDFFNNDGDIFDDHRFKVAPVLARTGKTASSGKSAKSHVGRKSVKASEAAVRARLLDAVRQSADRPNPVDVATLLLVSQAIEKSGLALEDVLDVLRLPQPIITITGQVAGFEERLIDLLRRGLVLPGRVATCAGYEIFGSDRIRFEINPDLKRQIIVFAGRKFDGDEAEPNGRRIGKAALSEYPILGVAETHDRLPETLRKAADVNLTCGPLTMDIIHATMRESLGAVSQGGICHAHCSALMLSDLALAIRPGLSVKKVLDTLDELGRMRRGQAKSNDGTPGRDSGNKTSSGSKTTTKSSRGNPGSGCEIIEPVAFGGTERDHFIPSIETLSGYGRAREWALGLKADLDLWRNGKLAWEEMSVKVLLSGPPGTGKTTFARALCNSLQVPLVVSSVATWLEPGYLGDVIKRMSSTFAEAEAHAPAILFIDEFDGIGRRGSGRQYDDYWNSLVNRLLELLDGAAKSSGVIVVGATNNPGAIDGALLRSGRLETHIEIPKPDTDALIGILRYHLRDDLDAVVASAPPAFVSAAVEDTSPAPEPGDPDGPQESTPDKITFNPQEEHTDGDL